MQNLNQYNIKSEAYVDDGKQNAIIDYIFWSFLILFTDPGGIVEALKIYYVIGKVNYTDISFVILSICYLIIPKTQVLTDLTFIKVKRFMIIFILYFYVFYIVIIPKLNHTENYSLLFSIIKTRRTLYNICLFIYIYEFFKRRWDIFIKTFLLSSIIILVLFVQARITKINILPVNIMNRKFVNIDRNLMISEGLMPLLIPLGIVLAVFKIKTKYYLLIITGFILMSAAYIFELWRRNFIAVFIYAVLAVLIDAYIRGNLTKILSNALKSLIILVVIITSLYLVTPKYIKAAYIAILETVSVVKDNKTTEGESDVRLGLNRPFINNLFYRHPIVGTGFDNRWRNHDGDVQGYEAADYPLLAALAMFGVCGIIMFGPVYIMLIRILKSDLQFFRKYYKVNRNVMHLLSISLVIYFIYHLMQYINYFIFISVSENFINYFFLSLYLASRANILSYELKRQTHRTDIKEVTEADIFIVK